MTSLDASANRGRFSTDPDKPTQLWVSCGEPFKDPRVCGGQSIQTDSPTRQTIAKVVKAKNRDLKKQFKFVVYYPIALSD